MTGRAAFLHEADLTPSALGFPVVGLGASAGGLAALQQFFAAMPASPGMAFVVVLHLSPKHASNVAGVLQGLTAMPVAQVSVTTPIAMNHVYVIAPTQALQMNDGALVVSEAEARKGAPVAVDLFFRSLAAVHRSRAVAIVLSGTGSDGAIGITRIKEQGGLTLAQAPDEAEFDGMPRAAIATQAVDWVLPVAEMPAKLVGLWANARRIELPSAEAPQEPAAAVPATEAFPGSEAETALRDIMATLRARTGHDFRHYKRATVLRRLGRRLQVNGLPNLPAYREHLKAEASEAGALLKDLLIGVTNFFRDREAFDALERDVIPGLFGAVAAGEPVRAWVAGCATGEEAYSVAMLLIEHAQRLSPVPPVQVFASDVDEQAIAVARAGVYPESIAADVTPARLQQFFHKDGDQYRVRTEVRERVLFAAHNILRDPPFGRLGLVSCRNLLIYLDRGVHAGLFETFHFALQSGGTLFLGGAESAEAAGPLFEVIDKKHRIYRSRGGPRSARVLPASAGGAQAPAALAPRPTAAERRSPTLAERHQQLAEQHAPPSVLIDMAGDIVHLSERAGRFLLHAGGSPSHHLVTLVLPELRLDLRTAVFQARRSGKSVETRRVPIERDGRRWFVGMIVRPVDAREGQTGLMLVLFDEVEETLAANTTDPRAPDPVLAHLEHELGETRHQLQQTIEHSETSNEELRAANEELQSINEELRSATEELETGREELQSINEELVTVNHELKAKVDEAGRLNDDLQNLIAATDLATVFIDRGLRIKRYTPRATALFSLIDSDLGRPLLDIAHRLDYPGLAGDAAEVFATLHPLEREVAGPDGRWYLARLVPYRTLEDRIDGAVLSFLDISDRREAEERAHVTDARLQLVADSTEDYAIVTFDAAERINGWNAGAERLFGHAAAETLGQPRAMLFVPEDRVAGVPAGELERVRESGRAAYDRWHLRRDGSRVYLSGVMTALVVGGVLHGYANITRDITASKQRADEREALLGQQVIEHAEARAANQLKDEFLAVVSHELKYPLNLILLNADLLAKLPETRDLPKVTQALGIIHDTVLVQAKIIDDLLDLSRINTDKLRLQRQAVDGAAIVARVGAALADDAERKGLRLTVDAGSEPVLLDADPVRVEQIVANLLGNALKFTLSGGAVTLRLRREGGFGVIEVSDTGRGIAAELLPKVFGLFQQGDVTSRAEGGLGIGLALVEQLTRLHGGRVQAASDGEGRGATFTVWLPEQGAGSAEAVPPLRRGLRLRGLSALVVDDDEVSLEVLHHLLSMEGLEVGTAPGAAQALAEVERRRWDFIITDIAMPAMDGYQLLQALQAQRHAVGVPVIAMTGFGRADDIKRALGAGFSAHLPKPVNVERLLDTLSGLLPAPQ